MDERKTTVRKLEEEKRADIDARNRLLEGIGEALFKRIGGGEPFDEKSGETPGAVLVQYRAMRGEIAESARIIKDFEAETLKLKELEAEISAKEDEKSALEKDFADIQVQLGKALLVTPGVDDFAGPLKQREELLLAKIEEQKAKLEDLDGREGGFFGWLGKNAQMAVTRTLLAKDSAALERLYRTTGEKFLSSDPEKAVEPEMSEDLEKAKELKILLAALTEEISGLKAERRRIVELFGADGSPAKRIHSLEKHIAHVKGEFPKIYRRFGEFAASAGGKETFSGILSEDDAPVLEKAEVLKSRIAEKELEIEKIKAAISIDNEKAEIEKTEKAITNQREKIAAAEKVIGDLRKQIAESNRRIDELNAFLSDGEKPAAVL